MGLLDVLQSASNAAASNVSAPVDGIAWILRKMGVPVPAQPLGGSDWMKSQGLTRDVKQGAASVAGETLGLLSPIAAAAKAPQIAGGLLKAAENAAAPRTLNPQKGAIVWHGSPHKFDAFDSSKIGTGEGAQAYGHGLYLAENPKTAQSYIAAGGAKADSTPERYAADIVGMMGGEQKALQHLQDILPPLGETTFGGESRDLIAGAIQAVQNGAHKSHMGSIYKVDLPDPAIARMLDWDKPLAEAERRRLAIAMIDDPSIQAGLGAVRDGRDVYEGIGRAMQMRGKPGTQADVSAWLREQGVPGLRYLDGGSRGTGTGTSNFVVFPGEENILSILERNGAPVR